MLISSHFINSSRNLKMSMTNVIRRAASGVTSGSQRYYHHHRNCSTLFSTAAPITPTAVLSQNLLFSSFSTAIQRRYSRKGNRIQRNATTRKQSNDALVKEITSEIRSAEESDNNDKVEDVPESFPFTIVDEQGKQTLTLTRDDHGESITVRVHRLEPNEEYECEEDEGEEDNNEHDDGDDSEATEIESHQLPMVVRVSKSNGQCLEFDVTAYGDEIVIESLAFKNPNAGEDGSAYEGPDFGDLDENLQKVLHKYLDARGINTRTANFLIEYMISKDSSEYLEWLKNFKKFVQA